jgi:hypothetical protein
MDYLNTSNYQTQYQPEYEREYQTQYQPEYDRKYLTQTKPQIGFDDISKDFELRKIIEEKNSTQSIKPDDKEQMDTMIRALPFMNDSIRTNILFGIELYKQLINLDRKYIHNNIINDK